MLKRVDQVGHFFFLKDSAKEELIVALLTINLVCAQGGGIQAGISKV